MSDPEPADKLQETRRHAPDATGYGLAAFTGLLIGATIGGFVFYAPGVGALSGAVIAIAAVVIRGRLMGRATRR